MTSQADIKTINKTIAEWCEYKHCALGQYRFWRDENKDIIVPDFCDSPTQMIMLINKIRDAGCRVYTETGSVVSCSIRKIGTKKRWEACASSSLMYVVAVAAYAMIKEKSVGENRLDRFVEAIRKA